MTVANVNIRQVLLKRGNTAASSTYTGPVGEVTVDTTLRAIRVHDGVTAGGWVMPSSTSLINLAANVSTLSNVVSTITGLDAGFISNINALYANASSQATAITYLTSNAATQSNSIAVLQEAGYITVGDLLDVLGSVDGNLIPSTDATYDLGSPSNQWRSLYVSGNTVNIGGVALSTTGGTLYVDGQAVVPNATNYTDSNVAEYLANYDGSINFTASPAIISGVGELTTANLTVHNFTQTGNSIILGTRTIDGDTIFNGDTTFNGTKISTGSQLITGNSVFIGNVTHSGFTQFNGGLDITEGATVQGNLIVSGTTQMIGDTTTVGNTTLTGDVHITGNVDTTGAVSNFGLSTFTGNINVDGAMIINNQINVTGTGTIAFNDSTVQSSAAASTTNNLDHITGAFSVVGTSKILNLSSDATPTNTPGTIVSRGASGNIAVGNVTATTLNTTSIGANSSIAGSLTVYGNLNVVGTTVTTQAVVTTVDTKTFTIAANAVSTVAMDGAAFLIGNIGGQATADWTYDDGQHAWRSNISVVPSEDDTTNLGSESRNWMNVFTGNINAYHKLNVGSGALTNYNTVAQFTANLNSWSQLVNQNLHAGTTASTDWVAANDIGSDTNNYIDVGINSSQNTDPLYSIQKANDGYMYVNGGNLTIGTQSTQTDVVFFTDGTTADREAGRIHQKRWLIGTPADDGVTRLQVGDNMKVAGTITAGNITIMGNLVTPNTTAVLLTAAQPNVTSLGTLTSLAVAGNVTAGNVNATNITAIQSGLTAANAAIVTANSAVVGYVNDQITSVNGAWTANAASQESEITGLRANITAANAAIVTANSAVVSYVNSLDSAMTSAWTANAAAQDTAISGLRANITAANVNITTLQSQVYTNSNVSAYLPTYAGNLGGTLTTAAQTNITSVGTLSALAVTGNVLTGNVSGTNGTFTNVAGTLLTPAQTNVTSVGTLTGLTVAGNVSAGNISLAAAGTMTLAAGTATTSPLKFTAGSLLTTTVPGAMNYDGNALYFTPSDAQRSLVISEQLFVLNADRTYVPGNGNQTSLFGQSVGVTTATRYHFAIKTAVSRSAGGSSTMRLGFAGTAALARVNFFAVSVNSVTTPVMNNTNITSGFATGSAVTASGANGTPNIIEVFGTIDVTTGGTLIPQIGWGVTPGTVTVPAGSLMRINPISATGGNTAIGTWTVG
jgi:hypothetical protein